MVLRGLGGQNKKIDGQEFIFSQLSLLPEISDILARKPPTPVAG